MVMICTDCGAILICKGCQERDQELVKLRAELAQLEATAMAAIRRLTQGRGMVLSISCDEEGSPVPSGDGNDS